MCPDVNLNTQNYTIIELEGTMEAIYPYSAPIQGKSPYTITEVIMFDTTFRIGSIKSAIPIQCMGCSLVDGD